MGFRRYIGTAAQRAASRNTGNPGDWAFETDTGNLAIADGRTILGALKRLVRVDEVTAAVQQYVTSLVVTNASLQALAIDTGYVYGIVDQNGRLALGIKPDGTVDILKLNLADGSIGVAKLGSDVTLPKAMGPTGASGAGMATYAVVDQNDQLAFWVTPDGSFEVGKLGPNFASLLSGLTGGAPTQYKTTYKTPVVGQMVSGPDFMFWGHSMLAGAGNDTGVTVQSRLQSLLTAAGSTATVRNGSVGGETSEAVVGRSGANPLLLLPTDGTIHADTSPTVVTYDVDGGHDSDQIWVLLQGTGIPGGSISAGIPGTLAGIHGSFKIVKPSGGSAHNADDYYTFTRDTAGTAVTVNRPTAFYGDFAAAHRNDITVFWMGRNNIANPTRVQADVAAAVGYLLPAHKRYFILSEHNSSAEPSGSANWTNATTINKNLRGLHGRRFIDTRSYLIKYGLADAGITATTQDNTDIANDVVPASLRAAGDSLHLNSAAQTIIGNLIYSRAVELGWV